MDYDVVASATKSNRDEAIDILKAFGIICVIMGHISNSPFHWYYYTFHIPLFFFVAGMLQKEDISIRRVIVKKTKTILVPYIIFWVISNIVFKQMRSLLQTGVLAAMDIRSFYGLILGGHFLAEYSNNYPIWFLQTFYIASIGFSLFFKYVPNKFHLIIALAAAIVSIPFQKSLGLRPVFRIDVLPISFVFLVLGNQYYKSSSIKAKEKKWQGICICHFFVGSGLPIIIKKTR